MKKKKAKRPSKTKLVPLLREHRFLPPRIDSPWKWSYSKLKTFDTCKRKFFWTALMRLSIKSPATSLVISNAVHLALKKWYGSRLSMRRIAEEIFVETEEAATEACQFYDQEEYDKLMVTLNTLVGMLIGYTEVYSSDRRQWKIPGRDHVEKWFSIPFDTGFVYNGFIDLAPIIGDRLHVVDHKALSVIQPTYIEMLPLDFQLRGYCAACELIFGELPTRVVYNIIKKCKLRQKKSEDLDDFTARIKDDYIERPEFYFHRELLRISRADIWAWRRDVMLKHEQFRNILETTKDPMTPEAWPVSDHACNDFNRLCEFYTLCTQGLDLGTSAMYTQYNPEQNQTTRRSSKTCPRKKSAKRKK